jgi:hypothetical protein
MLDDRNEPFPFLMAYDAVSMYADEDSSTMSTSFHSKLFLKVTMRSKLRMVLNILGQQLQSGLKLTLKEMKVEEEPIRMDGLE